MTAPRPKIGRPRSSDPKERWPRINLRVPPDLLARWREAGGTQDVLLGLIERWLDLRR